jgi:hypothetical protein
MNGVAFWRFLLLAAATLLAMFVLIGLVNFGPSDLERCVDDAAAGWTGTASELWTECAEQVNGR